MRFPFRSYRDAERDALAPLLEAALTLGPDRLPDFLDDLRRDAPTVAARLADLLARMSRPAPDPDTPAAVAVPATTPPLLPSRTPRTTLSPSPAVSTPARALVA